MQIKLSQRCLCDVYCTNCYLHTFKVLLVSDKSSFILACHPTCAIKNTKDYAIKISTTKYVGEIMDIVVDNSIINTINMFCELSQDRQYAGLCGWEFVNRSLSKI